MSETPPSGQSARVDGNDNIVVQIQGDNNTVNIAARARLALTRYLNRRRSAPNDNPLELLHPYSFALPRVGRDSELADLWQWMQSDAALSVRLIVGAGGTGKTRLALELCDQAIERGWDAGLATRVELDRFWNAQNLSTWGWPKQTLIAIDYAAAKAPTLLRWLTELADSSTDGRPPLRILLIERHADENVGWWHDMIGRGDADADAVRRLCDPTWPIELHRIGSLDERRALLAGMLTRLGRADLASSIDDAVDQKLAEATWGGEPLFLMMAAMTARDAGLASALALSSTEAAFKIAAIEAARIEKFATELNDGRFLGHMAAYATLCQGLTLDEARRAIEAERNVLGMTATGDVATILEALAKALPESSGGIAAVLPDVIGEALAVRELGVGRALDATAAVLRASDQADGRVGPVIIRAAQDLGIVDDTPLRWLDTIVAQIGDNVARLATLVGLLPDQTTVLRERATSLTQRIVDVLAIQGHSDRESSAMWLGMLALRLGLSGRRDIALEAGKESVRLYHELAADQPERFLPVLASALNNLCNQFSDVGQYESALAVIEETVTIRRRLCAISPDVFRQPLARALNNLSNRLSESGQREQALAAIREAVTLYRAITERSAGIVSPKFPLALDNLSHRLSDLGNYAEALVTGEEAVRRYREVAAVNPDGVRPDLARAIGNLSNQRRALGQREGALTASQESLDIYRDLFAFHPDAFRADIAGALTNLSLRLSDVGRDEEALYANREAVDRYRELVRSNSEAFLADFAGSLSNFSRLLSADGQQDSALAAILDAVAIYRRLDREHPGAFRRRLAHTLDSRSTRQSERGDHLAALESVREAVCINRELFELYPAASQADLAASLSNESLRLTGLGQHAEALIAGTEAVDRYRKLVVDHPSSFRPELAGALSNLSNALSAQGQHGAALDASQEAVAIYRELFNAEPDAFRPNLALVLGNLATQLSALDRHDDSIEAADESIVLYHQLKIGRPNAFRAELACGLNNLAVYRYKKDRRDVPAIAAILQAITIRRDLSLAHPEAFEPYLADSLGNLAVLLRDRDQHAEALPIIVEALKTLRPYFLTLPQAFAQRIEKLVNIYLRMADHVGQVPDDALLTPIEKALERLWEGENG